MTPAIRRLEKEKIPHQVLEYHHDPKTKAFGLEAAEKLALPYEQVFKTLVVEVDEKELVVAIIPVAESLEIIYVSGGKRGVDIGLSPQHLQSSLAASFVNIVTKES